MLRTTELSEANLPMHFTYIPASIVRREEEVEIKYALELKIGKRKKSRPLKRWIDVKEEDKRGVVQQDAGDRHGWRRRAVKRLPKLY